ncbi:hypothetical protein FO519_005518 [Halicephalobus sp. NKZ332]|nr:hypothetical protein FO519_005518 [Halicephalobus sp. NKZ332]
MDPMDEDLEREQQPLSRQSHHGEDDDSDFMSREATEVHILMSHKVRISRTRRMNWYLDFHDSFIKLTDPESRTPKAFQVFGVKLKDKGPFSPNEEFKIVSKTCCLFYSMFYRMSFVLDLSPTAFAADSVGNIIYTNMLPSIFKLLQEIVTPFSFPNSNSKHKAEVYVTLFAYCPYLNFPKPPVLMHGFKVNESTLKTFIQYAELNVKEFINNLLEYIEPINARRDKFNRQINLLEKMLRMAMLGLFNGPENSQPAVFIVTDGVLYIPDTEVVQSIAVNLKTNCVPLFFVQIAAVNHGPSLGFVPSDELLCFLSEVSFGKRLIHSDILGFERQDEKVSEIQQDVLAWSCQRSPFEMESALDTVKNESGRIRKHESKIKSNFYSLFHVRIREGYTLMDLNILKKGRRDVIIANFRLPWTVDCKIDYQISADYEQCDNRINEIQRVVTIETNYAPSEHIVDETDSAFTAGLFLTESERFALKVLNFNAQPEHYEVQKQTLNRYPGLYGFTKESHPFPTLLNKSLEHSKFNAFWQPLLVADNAALHRCSHTVPLRFVIQYCRNPRTNTDYWALRQQPENLGTFPMRKPVLQAIYDYFKTNTTFCLVAKYSYVKIVREGMSPPNYCYMVKIFADSTLLTIKVIFIGDCSLDTRMKIISKMKTDLPNLEKVSGALSIVGTGVDAKLLKYRKMTPELDIVRPIHLSPAKEIWETRQNIHHVTLMKFLVPKRMIWKMEKGIADTRFDKVAVEATNILVRRRILEGFKIVFEENGIVNMVREHSPNPVLPSRYEQYIIFPASKNQMQVRGPAVQQLREQLAAVGQKLELYHIKKTEETKTEEKLDQDSIEQKDPNLEQKLMEIRKEAEAKIIRPDVNTPGSGTETPDSVIKVLASGTPEDTSNPKVTGENSKGSDESKKIKRFKKQKKEEEPPSAVEEVIEEQIPIPEEVYKEFGTFIVTEFWTEPTTLLSDENGYEKRFPQAKEDKSVLCALMTFRTMQAELDRAPGLGTALVGNEPYVMHNYDCPPIKVAKGVDFYPFLHNLVKLCFYGERTLVLMPTLKFVYTDPHSNDRLGRILDSFNHEMRNYMPQSFEFEDIDNAWGTLAAGFESILEEVNENERLEAERMSLYESETDVEKVLDENEDSPGTGYSSPGCTSLPSQPTGTRSLSHQMATMGMSELTKSILGGSSEKSKKRARSTASNQAPLVFSVYYKRRDPKTIIIIIVPSTCRAVLKITNKLVPKLPILAFMIEEDHMLRIFRNDLSLPKEFRKNNVENFCVSRTLAYLNWQINSKLSESERENPASNPFNFESQEDGDQSFLDLNGFISNIIHDFLFARAYAQAAYHCLGTNIHVPQAVLEEVLEERCNQTSVPIGSIKDVLRVTCTHLSSHIQSKRVSRYKRHQMPNISSSSSSESELDLQQIDEYHLINPFCYSEAENDEICRMERTEFKIAFENVLRQHKFFKVPTFNDYYFYWPNGDNTVNLFNTGSIWNTKEEEDDTPASGSSDSSAVTVLSEDGSRYGMDSDDVNLDVEPLFLQFYVNVPQADFYSYPVDFIPNCLKEVLNRCDSEGINDDEEKTAFDNTDVKIEMYVLTVPSVDSMDPKEPDEKTVEGDDLLDWMSNKEEDLRDDINLPYPEKKIILDLEKGIRHMLEMEKILILSRYFDQQRSFKNIDRVVKFVEEEAKKIDEHSRVQTAQSDMLFVTRPEEGLKRLCEKLENALVSYCKIRSVKDEKAMTTVFYCCSVESLEVFCYEHQLESDFVKFDFKPRKRQRILENKENKDEDEGSTTITEDLTEVSTLKKDDNSTNSEEDEILDINIPLQEDGSLGVLDEKVKRKQIIHDFWLLAKIEADPMKIKSFFFQRPNGCHDSLFKKFTDKLVEEIKNVNRTLLLEEMHDTQECSPFLIEDEDVPKEIQELNYSSLDHLSAYAKKFVVLPSKVKESSKTLQGSVSSSNSIVSDPQPRDNLEPIRYMYSPGYFFCPLVWKHWFEINPRLRQKKFDLGWIALKSGLENLAVKNRKNVYVFKEKDGNVVYIYLFADAQTAINTSKITSENEVNEIKKKMKKNILLMVFGIKEPGEEVKTNVVNMLQKKLDGKVMEELQEALLKNPQLKMNEADISFIQQNVLNPVAKFYFTLPMIVSDYLTSVFTYLKQHLSIHYIRPKFFENSENEKVAKFKPYPKDGPQEIPENFEGFMFLLNKPRAGGQRTTGIGCCEVRLIDKEGRMVPPEKMLAGKLNPDSFSLLYPGFSGHSRNQRTAKFQELTKSVQLESLEFQSTSISLSHFIEVIVWQAGDIGLEELQTKLRILCQQALADLIVEFGLMAQPFLDPIPVPLPTPSPPGAINRPNSLTRQTAVDQKTTLKKRGSTVASDGPLPTPVSSSTLVPHPPLGMASPNASILSPSLFSIDSSKPSTPGPQSPRQGLTKFPFDSTTPLASFYSDVSSLGPNKIQWKSMSMEKDTAALKPACNPTQTPPLPSGPSEELRLDFIPSTAAFFYYIERESRAYPDMAKSFQKFSFSLDSKYTSEIILKVIYAKLVECFKSTNDSVSILKPVVNKDGGKRLQTLTEIDSLSSPHINQDRGYLSELDEDYVNINYAIVVYNKNQMTSSIKQSLKTKDEPVSPELHVHKEFMIAKDREVQIEEDVLNRLLTKCEEAHYVQTPLLLFPEWRSKMAAIRAMGSEFGSVRKRKQSAPSKSSEKKSLEPKMKPRSRTMTDGVPLSRPNSEEPCSLNIQYMLAKEYVQYLEKYLGAKLIQVKSSQNDLYSLNYSTVSSPPVIWLQTSSPGGILLINLFFSEPYFCIRILFWNRGLLSEEQNLVELRSFIKMKNILTSTCHLHSFTYDFHLRIVSTYLIGGTKVLFNRGYNTSAFLIDFIQYYSCRPPSARNCLFEEDCLFENLKVPGVHIWENFLNNESKYEWKVVRLKTLEKEGTDEFMLVSIVQKRIFDQEYRGIRLITNVSSAKENPMLDAPTTYSQDTVDGGEFVKKDQPSMIQQEQEMNFYSDDDDNFDFGPDPEGIYDSDARHSSGSNSDRSQRAAAVYNKKERPSTNSTTSLMSIDKSMEIDIAVKECLSSCPSPMSHTLVEQSLKTPVASLSNLDPSELKNKPKNPVIQKVPPRGHRKNPSISFDLKFKGAIPPEQVTYVHYFNNLQKSLQTELEEFGKISKTELSQLVQKADMQCHVEMLWKKLLSLDSITKRKNQFSILQQFGNKLDSADAHQLLKQVTSVDLNKDEWETFLNIIKVVDMQTEETRLEQLFSGQNYLSMFKFLVLHFEGEKRCRFFDFPDSKNLIITNPNCLDSATLFEFKVSENKVKMLMLFKEKDFSGSESLLFSRNAVHKQFEEIMQCLSAFIWTDLMGKKLTLH